MQKKNLKRIGNFLLLIVVFVVTLWSVFYGEDIGEIIEYLKDAKDSYIVAGVVCVILFIVGESVVIYYLMRTLGHRVKFFHCCLYSFIGFFYSCITPSASGGQPMQVVAMRKDKIPVAVSTVVLAIVTITYKFVLVLIGIVVLGIRPSGLMKYLDGVRGIIYLGLVLNIVFIVFLLMLVFDPNLVRKMSEKLLYLWHKIRPFHNFEKQQKWLDGIIDQYHGTAEFFRTHKFVMVNVLVITFVQRVVLFLVTWFTYQSFELSGHCLPIIVSLQAMIAVAADMLPLPGGMGVSENLFLVIFDTIFGEERVVAGMVISRGLGYYTQLLISAVMTVLSSIVLRDPQITKREMVKIQIEKMHLAREQKKDNRKKRKSKRKKRNIRKKKKNK